MALVPREPRTRVPAVWAGRAVFTLTVLVEQLVESSGARPYLVRAGLTDRTGGARFLDSFDESRPGQRVIEIDGDRTPSGGDGDRGVLLGGRGVAVPPEEDAEQRIEPRP